MIKINYFDEG